MGPPCQALAQTNELIQDTGPCHMLACQGRIVCSLLLAPSAEAQLPAERRCVMCVPRLLHFAEDLCCC